VRRRYLLAPGAWPWRLARPALPPGRRSRDPAAVLAGLRLGGLAAGTLTGVLILCWAGRPAIPILPALLAGGTAIVDLATATAAARAERALILELPHALDLLAAGLAAGMSLEVAILWCAHQSGPPSNAVFARVGTRLASGEPPAVALRAEADLSGVGLLVAIAGVVGRCRRQGLPAAPAIVAISDGARAKARTALLDRSGRSGPLATVVVAVLIAPACVAALVIALAGGFLSGGGFEVAALGTRHL